MLYDVALKLKRTSGTSLDDLVAMILTNYFPGSRLGSGAMTVDYSPFMVSVAS